ncbi:MAG: DNA repair protein rad2 [Thelocarpon impressellum]|nr:MAG: DNA repair protein rad2 [Thelocarpon impressellum]
MGVTGLWTVLAPCARPVKLETLNKKRLAVDASIWIYQFLKAVRDKEGNALRNSHVVGFFRRICKLLFFGIRPVFVFDGGAPALKRQTIAGRKRRREGRREDAARTAGKLLALQMQRRAEEDAERRRQELARPAQPDEDEEEVPEELVYVEELQMTKEERQRNRTFRKKDAYHLPDLNDSLAKMGAPDDPRIMSQEELEEYARQFNSGEDINLYDFSKIDFNSAFFLSLPASDRYNILNAARLRSRLRMGYSKEQLDTMFPDRMAFSRFQIERVTERNELTQRLMNINGMNGEDAMNGVGRVAGEKGKEYVLVKNDGVEGGWALGVVTNKEEGGMNRPIDVDGLAEAANVGVEEGDEDSEEGGFEDVPIEGLNRLPKRRRLGDDDDDRRREMAERRRALYESRRERPRERTPIAEDPNSLFVAGEDGNEPSVDDLFEDAGGMALDDDDEALDRAIAMSLEDHVDRKEDDKVPLLDEIGQSKASEPKAFSKASGKMIAHIANNRSNAAVPKSQPSRPIDSDDDDIDLETALAESRRLKPQVVEPQPKSPSHAFSGPLPFEKLDFSKSILGAKKTKPDAEAGGFEKQAEEEVEKPKPLPPWFSSDVQESAEAKRNFEDRQREAEELSRNEEKILHRQDTNAVIEVESSDSEVEMVDVVPIGSAVQRGNAAELASAEPPISRPDGTRSPDLDLAASEEPVEWEESDREEARPAVPPRSPSVILENVRPQSDSPAVPPLPISDSFDQTPAEDEEADYSDPEDDELMRALAVEAEEHARFASELNHKSHTQNQEDYERELRALRGQQKKDRRDADEVSAIMVGECQALLTLFGLPYVTAPMEAEAQCAELVRLGLVDGIVTDDSDCLLFGGTRVYKNMFSQAKFVECYLASDLEREFDLDRSKLIRIAHLLGSDYTEGIPGIGPVTALEIISEFDSEAGLEDFRDWLQGVQRGAPSTPESAFRRKFRRNATRLFLPPSFPSPAVTAAYLHPDVDASPEPFAWGVPDLDRLRGYLMATIGWTQERTDEVLVPVIRDMNRREREGTQSNITGFFSGGVGAGSNAGAGALGRGQGGRGGSKRLEGAFGRLREARRRKRPAEDQGSSASQEADGSGEGVEQAHSTTTRGRGKRRQGA